MGNSIGVLLFIVTFFFLSDPNFGHLRQSFKEVKMSRPIDILTSTGCIRDLLVILSDAIYVQFISSAYRIRKSWRTFE